MSKYIPRKRGPYRRLKPTQFELKWGVDCETLAREENVTTTCLHMRVYLYGTPYQRAPKPHPLEAKFGMTPYQIAQLLNINLSCVQMRFKKWGTPFIITSPKRPAAPLNPAKIRPNVYKGWLHPRHPDYAAWVEKCEKLQENIRYVDTTQ